MSLPTSLSVSIEQETYLKGENGKPEEKYGADYAGTIKCRWPTLGDEINVRCSVHAMIEAYGVQNPRLAPPWIYSLVTALVYVQVLKDGDPPSWFGEGTANSDKGQAAIVRVYTLLQEKIDAAKKDSAGSGATPSSGA